MLKCDLLACKWLHDHDNMMNYGWICNALFLLFIYFIEISVFLYILFE